MSAGIVWAPSYEYGAAGKFTRRSVPAMGVELLLRAMKKWMDEEELKEDIRRLPEENDIPYALPRKKIRVPVEERDHDGMQVFTLNPGASRCVLYLHGGAYVHQPTGFHWSFLNKLALKTGAEIVVPIYPKAPNHDYRESYSLLTALYREIVERHGDRCVFMGDSAGGGMALGLCQQFALEGIAQPRRLVLFSPWVDIRTDNPDIAPYESSDPMMDPLSLQMWTVPWAGGTDMSDFRLSPIEGEVSMLRDVWLFVGERELFCPDVVEFFEKLKARGVPSSLYIGKSMNHAFPLYPIPEAKEALEIVSDAVLREGL